MRKRHYVKKRRLTPFSGQVVRRLIFLVSVVLAVYFIPGKTDELLSQTLRAVTPGKTAVNFILKTGLGMKYDLPNFMQSPVTFFFPELKKDRETVPTAPEDKQGPDASASEASPEAENENTGGAPSDSPASPQPDNGSIISTTITGEGSSRYLYSGGIYFNNKTQYTIDGDELVSQKSGIKLSDDGPQVLIIHTHGSEAYTPDGEDMYVASDPSRTEDKRFNTVRVGDELTKLLEDRGIRVIHDRELYDYPSYTGSYNRSLESIERYLKDYPSIKIVLDLHRDALEGDGVTYKTVADIKDNEPCSQIMIVVGTDYNGLEHKAWRENLKFAVMLQRSMYEKYPTLARPLTVSGSRYNQHMTTGSLIIEVGTNGNTLKEALAAVRLFGDCAADVIGSLKE